MNFDKDTALNFFAVSAQVADRHAQHATLNNATEPDLLLSLPVLCGEAIRAHGCNDAAEFTKALRGLVAVAAICEQWTISGGGDECECDDCTAKAVAVTRAKAEADRAPKDLQYKDFYWIAPLEDNAGMIVTANPDAYKTYLNSAWNHIRAKNYNQACVIALNARNARKNAIA